MSRLAAGLAVFVLCTVAACGGDGSGGSDVGSEAPQPKSADGSVLLALRPEKITVAREPTNKPNSVEGRIADFKFFGSTFYLQIATELLGRVMVKMTAGESTLQPAIGESVWLGWNPDGPVVVQAS